MDLEGQSNYFYSASAKIYSTGGLMILWLMKFGDYFP